MKENNIPIPDIGGRVEIKTIRRDSQSLITLFTFNRIWHIKQRELINRYGYIDEKGRCALKKIQCFMENLFLKDCWMWMNAKIQHLVDINTKEVLATWDVFVMENL